MDASCCGCFVSPETTTVGVVLNCNEAISPSSSTPFLKRENHFSDQMGNIFCKNVGSDT